MVVAQRLPVALLGALLKDQDWQVRYHAAQRAHPSALAALLADADEVVRELARQRYSETEYLEESVHG
jgi:hypothetical protein